MIHAKVCNLEKHMGLGNTPFTTIMDEIDANQQEGSSSFELDVLKITDEECIDLIEALEVMGYIVTYEKGEALFYVNADL